MGTKAFLGEPPASIKAWIMAHTAKKTTIFTLQGGTTEEYDIVGTLDREWMADNGFYDDENGEWLKTITSVVVGSHVNNIGNYAFADCSELTSMTIPNDVTNIGNLAFSGCTSLTSVTIPDGVTSIGNAAFKSCGGMTSMTIPDIVTSIGEEAFTNCSSLTSVTITANGGNAQNVKSMMITAGCPSNITWNMPS